MLQSPSRAVKELGQDLNFFLRELSQVKKDILSPNLYHTPEGNKARAAAIEDGTSALDKAVRCKDRCRVKTEMKPRLWTKRIVCHEHLIRSTRKSYQKERTNETLGNYAI